MLHHFSINFDELLITNINVTEWPIIPEGTKEVHCRYSRITKLPFLPEGLEVLDCCYVPLESLPILPKSLKRLDCRSTNIKKLPVLPENLEYLFCGRTKITKLPSLPPQLKLLHCQDNEIDELDELPPNLVELVFDLTNVKRIKNFPSSLRYVRGPKIEWIPRPPQDLNYLLFSEKSFGFTESDTTIRLWNHIHDIYENEKKKRLRLACSKRTKPIAEMILYDPKSPFVREFKDHFEKTALR